MENASNRKPFGSVIARYVRLIALLYIIYLLAYFCFYAVSSYHLMQERQRSVAQSASSYLNAATNNVKQITSALQSSSAVNSIMYTPLTVGPEVYAAAYAEINKQVVQYDLLESCYLYSRRAGMVLVSEEGKYDIAQFYDAPFLTSIGHPNPMTVSVHRPPPRVMRSVQSEVMTIATRFSSAMRDNAGYLCVNLSLDRLRAELATLAGQGMGVFVCTQDGPLFGTWSAAPSASEVYSESQALNGYGLRVMVMEHKAVFLRALLRDFFEGSALFFVFSVLVGLVMAMLLANFGNTFRSMVIQLADLYKKEEAAQTFSLNDLNLFFGKLVRDYRDFSTQLEQTGQIVREKALLDLLTGNAPTGGELGQLSDRMQADLPHRWFAALCVHLEGRDEAQTPGETIASRALVRSLLESPDDPVLYTTLDNDSDVVGIVNYSDEAAPTVHGLLQSLADRARGAFEEGGRVNVFFSISMPVDALVLLPEAFSRAKRNLCYRYVAGTNGCFFDRGEDGVDGSLLPEAVTRKVLLAVDARAFDAVYECQRAIMNEWSEGGGELPLLQARLLTLCGLILDRTSRAGSAQAVAQCMEHIRRLAGAGNAAEAGGAFCALVEQCSHMTAGARGPGDMNEYIAKALEFIEASYERELTVGEIAEHLNLNPKYFSRLFKERTGRTIMQHLSKLRMERAMGLLRQTDLTVRQIGGMVGFDESRSFIRHFKKYTGLTPGEFRSQNREPAAQT